MILAHFLTPLRNHTFDCSFSTWSRSTVHFKILVQIACFIIHEIHSDTPLHQLWKLDVHIYDYVPSLEMSITPSKVPTLPLEVVITTFQREGLISILREIISSEPRRTYKHDAYQGGEESRMILLPTRYSSLWSRYLIERCRTYWVLVFEIRFRFRCHNIVCCKCTLNNLESW